MDCCEVLVVDSRKGYTMNRKKNKFKNVAELMVNDYLTLEKMTGDNRKGIPYTALGKKYGIDSSAAGNIWRGVRAVMLNRYDETMYGGAAKAMVVEGAASRIDTMTYKDVDEEFGVRGNAGMMILIGVAAAVDNITLKDESDFEKEVDSILLGPKPLRKPEGKTTPKSITASRTIYERDPEVKAWVLRRANGKCELCHEEAPFVKSNGLPYLEVHHIVQLALGGPDTIENTVAVCPNCHRALHFADEKNELANELRRVKRS